VVINQTNYMGTMLFVTYMVAALYYFYIRATKTLDIGYVWWVPSSLAWLPSPCQPGNEGGRVAWAE
jgi:hypothetical protein